MAEGLKRAIITDDDHGALLAIITWFLASTLFICTATRIAIRLPTRHLHTVDDALLLLAAALAIGNTIAISLAVESGLGKRSFLLTAYHVEEIQKEIYAATILYVLTIGISKLSIVAFFARLACTKSHRTAVVSLGVAIVCWILGVTAGVAFQCQLPHPWETFTGRCISMVPFWFSVSIVDMVTDVAMIILPIVIVSGLQLGLRKKATVMLIFTFRIVLIVASIFRLIFLQQSINGDHSFDSIPFYIATQCHSALAVIVACSPALKPFIDNVRTGMLNASLAKRSPGTTFGQDSYNMQILTKTTTSKSERKSGASEPPSASQETRTSFGRRPTPHYIHIPNPPARIVAQPLLPPISDASSVSMNTRIPPRPPPPPEELRPDLSLFRPRIYPRSTAVADEPLLSEQRTREGSGRAKVEMV